MLHNCTAARGDWELLCSEYLVFTQVSHGFAQVPKSCYTNPVLQVFWKSISLGLSKMWSSFWSTRSVRKEGAMLGKYFYLPGFAYIWKKPAYC